jgi:tetratricopeptide (TPR) repeat protein
LQVVPDQSATHIGRGVKVGLSVDHFGLIKFGSRTRDYKLILSKLLDLIKPIASQRHNLYSVPLEVVPTYTQRPGLSLAIKEKLHKHDRQNDAPHALAIHGLGGSGKTQLALNYVMEHREDYSPTLWIDAQDRETTLSSFYRCATELQLQVSSDPVQVSALVDSPTVQTVLRWLRDRKESDHEWLVVLDNADDFSWGLGRIIPKGRRGNVIITSQDGESARSMNSECEKLEVGTMGHIEARGLLLRHLKLNPGSASKDVQTICEKIVKRLGYLPLAIDLAGATIDKKPDQEEALKQYLAYYNTHRDELLQSAAFRDLSASQKTVWTVWDATLAKIKEQYPDVHSVLAFLAHFKHGFVQDELFRLACLGYPTIIGIVGEDHANVPDWLKQLTKPDGQKWDDFYYRKILSSLSRYSLVQPVRGNWPGVSMHKLVQWRAGKHTESQAYDFWYLIFMVSVCHQVGTDRAKPEFRRQMITHIPDVSRTSLSAAKLHDEVRAAVFETISYVYLDEGRWREAEKLRAQVMTIRIRVLGPKHVQTLSSMINLASIFWAQGRLDKAEEIQMQVVEISKKVLGREHPDTLASMGNLASTLWAQQRLKEAEEIQMQVVETSKKVFGQEHPDTLASMGNLASTLRAQQRLKEAEEIQMQVVETSKKVFGQEHPDTLASMRNLASTLRAQQRLKKAEEIQMQVVETSQKVLGQEHPDTLAYMNNLAFILRAQQRLKEAVEIQMQVVETSKKVFGQEHPDTLASMRNLVLTLMAQQRSKEAEEIQMQVLETRKKVLGQEHPDMLRSMHNLAVCWKDQGHNGKAIVLMAEVVELGKRIWGVDHPDTKDSVEALAIWQAEASE